MHHPPDEAVDWLTAGEISTCLKRPLCNIPTLMYQGTDVRPANAKMCRELLNAQHKPVPVAKEAGYVVRIQD
jgi:hypothetical protein